MNSVGLRTQTPSVAQGEPWHRNKGHLGENTNQDPSVSCGWADRIRSIWARGGANTLDLARIVRSARAELKRGEWCALWDSGEMPFSRRKAQMLLVIADGLNWANVNTCAQIPQGWRILYHLARLRREHLEHLIAEGVVHPRLKLTEARKLSAHLRPERPADSVKSPRVIDRLNKLERFVNRTIRDWSAAQRALALEKLLEIASAIEAHPTRTVLASKGLP